MIRECKYIFIFPKINSAQQRSSWCTSFVWPDPWLQHALAVAGGFQQGRGAIVVQITRMVRVGLDGRFRGDDWAGLLHIQQGLVIGWQLHVYHCNMTQHFRGLFEQYKAENTTVVVCTPRSSATTFCWCTEKGKKSCGVAILAGLTFVSLACSLVTRRAVDLFAILINVGYIVLLVHLHEYCPRGQRALRANTIP